jgi:hypothetical protein
VKLRKKENYSERLEIQKAIDRKDIDKLTGKSKLLLIV